MLKSKGAKEFGLHAFLASNTVTNDYYPMLAKVLFEQAVKLSKEAGVHIKFINLSGGIGIPYKPDQEPNDIYAIGEGVRKVYEEVLVPAGMGDVAIYTELGRYMMGPYGCLVTKAIHEKNTYKNYINISLDKTNLMMYLGGIIGVFNILILNIIVPRISPVILTLLSFIGQLVSGMVIDAFVYNMFSISKILGCLIVIAGLVIYQLSEEKA